MQLAKTDWDYWGSPDGCAQLEQWAREGLGVGAIARKAGMTERALRARCAIDPAMLNAVCADSQAADRVLEQTLFELARGFEYTERRVETSERGEKEVITHKRAPASLSAIQFWLKNRQPERWGGHGAEEEDESDGFLQALGQQAAALWTGGEDDTGG